MGYLRLFSDYPLELGGKVKKQCETIITEMVGALKPRKSTLWRGIHPRGVKFMFIDESERQKSGRHKYFFCLCGLIIDGENLISLNNSLDELRVKYELKTLKDLRGNLPHKTKMNITQEICRTLQSNNSTVISSILGEISLESIETVNGIYFEALTFLIERFFIHLQRAESTGVVISDDVGKNVERNLRKVFFDFISEESQEMLGKKMGYFKNRIYPSILFSSDNFSSVLQATDLIVASLNSACWRNIQETQRPNVEDLPNKNKYLKIYWPLFAKSPTGKVDGWGVKVWW